MHIAAAHLHRNIIDYIFQHKIIDINQLDKSERNALHWALIWSATRKVNPKKLFAIVELLHSYGYKNFKIFALNLYYSVSLTQQDQFGAVPFHYAAMTGKWSIW